MFDMSLKSANNLMNQIKDIYGLSKLNLVYYKNKKSAIADFKNRLKTQPYLVHKITKINGLFCIYSETIIDYSEEMLNKLGGI